MKLNKLTTKESLALQTMVYRAGITPVLEDIHMLVEEMTGKDTRWQDVASALYDALCDARRIADSMEDDE